MSEYNKVRLLVGKAYLTANEFKNFHKGDTIYGVDRSPEVVDVWGITEKEQAKEALSGYRCTYEQRFHGYEIREAALEYYEADEDGEFVSGSDFDLADEVE